MAGGGQNIFGESAGLLQGAGNTYGQVMGGPGIAGGINTYMNPYMQSVVDQTLQDIQRQTALQQNINAAAAARAGAFGGARHGLVEAETNEAAQRQMAQTAAGLRSAGFNTAASLAAQDIDRRLAAAGGAMNLGQTGVNLGTGVLGLQEQQGAAARQIQQALMTQGAGMFDRYTSQPMDTLRLRTGALGANPLTQTGTRTGTYNPGLLDWFGAGASLGGAALGLK